MYKLVGSLLVIVDGAAAMAGSAVIGGVLLALIEGVGILITRWSADQFNQVISNFRKINFSLNFLIFPES